MEFQVGLESDLLQIHLIVAEWPTGQEGGE